MMKHVVVGAAVMGLASVMMGAAGDHALEGLLTPAIQERFTIALHYHQLYSMLLLGLGLYGAARPRGAVFAGATGLFAAGVLIFSGSLYLSIFLSLPALVYGTPVGGLMLMAGWVIMAVYGICLKRSPASAGA